jgi:LmbE family N-acetylglucosaminyl deacetylase
VLSPHPDDDAIGCGGTLRQHVVNGDQVKLIVLTSGEAGGHGWQTPDETAKLREHEALAACQVTGIDDTEFWREPDGRLQATEPLVARLKSTIESWQPRYIYAPHPNEMHVDHRAATELLRLALESFPKVLSNLTIRLYEVWTPIQSMDEIVDISDFVDSKRAAIREHKTQIRAMRLDEAALALNRYRGEMHSWPGGDYAEVFQGLKP